MENPGRKWKDASELARKSVNHEETRNTVSVNVKSPEKWAFTNSVQAITHFSAQNTLLASEISQLQCSLSQR